MYTPEFHGYHTVILLSDLEFVALISQMRDAIGLVVGWFVIN